MIKKSVTAMAIATVVATTSISGTGVSFQSTQVSAATKDGQKFELGGFSYEIIDKNLHVKMTGVAKDSAVTEVVVPDEVNFEEYSFPVTQIKDSAFKGNVNIKKVVLGKNVKKVGAYAFDNCTNIAEITLNEGVEDIGRNAFAKTSISSIALPSTYIKSDMVYCSASGPFSECNNLKNITFADGMSVLPSYVFANCQYLKSFTIPNTIIEIGEGAFQGCKEITEVTIPDSVEKIGKSAFKDCSSLKAIDFPKNLTTMGKWAFGNCTQLTEVLIPKTLEDIDNEYSESVSPFMGCEKLSTFTFEEGTTKIPAYIFSGDTYVVNVKMPESVTEIGKEAFREAVNISDIKLPTGLTKIDALAFSKCSRLKAIQLPETLEVLGRNSFAQCENLESFTIPANVTSIDPEYTANPSPFTGCSRLKKVVVADGMKILPAKIFNGATYVEEVVLPSGLEEIGELAFVDCEKLETIQLPDSITIIGKAAFRNAKALKNVKLPSKLKTIGSCAFTNCSRITEMTIPATLTTVTDVESPFSECPTLKKVVFEEGMTKIPASILKGATSVNEVSLPGTVTEIEKLAFCETKELKAIALPNGITSIGNYAFRNSGIKGVILPDALKTIGTSAFGECDSLEYIKLNSTITADNELFGKSDLLKDIEITSNVTALPKNMFRNYSGDYIVIPGSVTQIGKTCFGGVSDAFVIYGVAGSAAEKYATENKITFKDISGAPKINVPDGVLATVPSKVTNQTETKTDGTTGENQGTNETPSKESEPEVKAPKAVSISSAKRTGATKAKITWKKISDAAGYEIIYSTSKDFKSKKTKVVAAGRTSFTISGLKKKTCYYVKIRAYKKNSKGKKIYGAYSARKTIAKK